MTSRVFLGWVTAVVLTPLLAYAVAEKIDPAKLPKSVEESIHARFSGATITGAEKETEKGQVIYDIELKYEGRKCEMDVKEDGTVLEIERQIDPNKVPRETNQAIQTKYPQSSVKEVMEVNKVQGKDEKLDHYEVVLETTDKKELEIIASLDGKSVGTEDELAKISEGWRDIFTPVKENLTSMGKNPYFILEPGFCLKYQSGEKSLTITVLDETKTVDGVTTRVVEEREEKNRQPLEIAKNYYAIDKKTLDVYYFGEDVAIYTNGKVSSQEGSWLSGVDGAKFGLMMPGTPKVKDKYYQELAPQKAMDRAEIVSTDAELTTPAGAFKNCVRTSDSSALEAGESEKIYAPNVGVIKDDEFVLTEIVRPKSAP